MRSWRSLPSAHRFAPDLKFPRGVRGEGSRTRLCGGDEKSRLGPRGAHSKAALPKTQCTFERIYFSRGNDADIYRERKALGAGLTDQIWSSVKGDLANSVFSFIPNTAEVAYFGLMSELRFRRRAEVKQTLLDAAKAGTLDEKLVDHLILDNWPRGEKIVTKDVKMRTFISQEKSRNNLASLVYDVTYGVVQPKDNLVCVDDSIVRGTTLRRSILRILKRLNPKKIIIASTAPQIRYPDCYGIDMSEIGKFVAFEAAITLLKERGQNSVIAEVYNLCRDELANPSEQPVNHVRKIYESFTAEEISKKITELVSPKPTAWKGEIEIIYQSIENLHRALPNHTGDWYFTGKYPTPGGYRVVNQAYVNYFEKAGGEKLLKKESRMLKKESRIQKVGEESRMLMRIRILKAEES